MEFLIFLNAGRTLAVSADSVTVDSDARSLKFAKGGKTVAEFKEAAVSGWCERTAFINFVAEEAS